MCALLASIRAAIAGQAGADEHHLHRVQVLFQGDGDLVAVTADGVLYRLIGIEHGVLGADVLQECYQVGLAGDPIPKDDEGIAWFFAFLSHE